MQMIHLRLVCLLISPVGRSGSRPTTAMSSTWSPFPSWRTTQTVTRSSATSWRVRPTPCCAVSVAGTRPTRIHRHRAGRNGLLRRRCRGGAAPARGARPRARLGGGRSTHSLRGHTYGPSFYVSIPQGPAARGARPVSGWLRVTPLSLPWRWALGSLRPVISTVSPRALPRPQDSPAIPASPPGTPNDSPTRTEPSTRWCASAPCEPSRRSPSRRRGRPVSAQAPPVRGAASRRRSAWAS